MNIAWLIENTEISGVNRVVLAAADALIARGHRARIVTTELPLTWRASSAEWVYVDTLLQYQSSTDDIVVSTSLTTLEAAWVLGGPRAVYYCFGREDSTELANAGAASRMPMLAASEPLVARYSTVTQDITVIGTIVDDEVYRRVTPRERQPPRVLLCGPAWDELRGIQDGYGAVAHARWFHQKLDLIRVSPWAPSREEPLDDVQEFHIALSATEMTRLLHSCDIVLGPGLPGAAFSLTIMEAMAAGIPVVLTAIPTFLSFGEEHDYALFGPARKPVELGERLIEMLDDAPLRQRLAERGREVAEQWRAPTVAERLERFFISRQT